MNEPPEEDGRPQPRKIAEAEQTLHKLLAQVTRRGYYGNGCLVVSVADGFIQALWMETKQITK